MPAGEKNNFYKILNENNRTEEDKENKEINPTVSKNKKEAYHVEKRNNKELFGEKSKNITKLYTDGKSDKQDDLYNQVDKTNKRNTTSSHKSERHETHSRMKSHVNGYVELN